MVLSFLWGKKVFMTRMKIISIGTDFTVTVEVGGILLEYKRYKKDNFDLLVGKNSFGIKYPDIFDLSTAEVVSGISFGIEKHSIIDICLVNLLENNTGYLYVPGGKWELFVHHLVEFTWLNSTKPVDRYENDCDGSSIYNIDHINGDKHDNRLSNIELVYREVNVARAFKNGYREAPKYLTEVLEMLKNSTAERKDLGLKNIIRELGK